MDRAMRPFPSTSPNRSNHPLLIAMTLGLSACGGGGSREAAAFPTSPANLRLVLASPDAVTLEWTDRSDDEEGFLIDPKVYVGLFFLQREK